MTDKNIRRTTDDLLIAPAGWEFHDTSIADDEATLEFLLQPPRDLSERGSINKNTRGRLFVRVLLRCTTLLYAFLFGMSVATNYNLPEIILIGVALACAFVTVEVL